MFDGEDWKFPSLFLSAAKTNLATFYTNSLLSSGHQDQTFIFLCLGLGWRVGGIFSIDQSGTGVTKLIDQLRMIYQNHKQTHQLYILHLLASQSLYA